MDLIFFLGGLAILFMATMFDERGDSPFKWTFNAVGAVFIGLSLFCTNECLSNFWEMIF